VQLLQAVAPQGTQGRFTAVGMEEVLQGADTHVAVQSQIRHPQITGVVLRDVIRGSGHQRQLSRVSEGCALAIDTRGSQNATTLIGTGKLWELAWDFCLHHNIYLNYAEFA